MTTTIDNNEVSEFVDRLLAGDRKTCARRVEEMLERDVALRALYEELFAPALYRIGEMWEHNRISVASEHLATSITESLLALAYPHILDTPHVGKTAVVSCGPNEYHQIGGRMVADMLELNGWDSHFLGANTPTPDLLHMIEAKEPDLLALSLSVYFNMDGLLDTLMEVERAFPDLPVVAGGQAFRWGGLEALADFPRVRVLSSLAEFELTLKKRDA